MQHASGPGVLLAIYPSSSASWPSPRPERKSQAYCPVHSRMETGNYTAGRRLVRVAQLNKEFLADSIRHSQTWYCSHSIRVDDARLYTNRPVPLRNGQSRAVLLRTQHGSLAAELSHVLDCAFFRYPSTQIRFQFPFYPVCLSWLEMNIPDSEYRVGR